MAEQHDSITFTMRLDASDLKKLFGSAVVPAAARAGAQSSGGGGGGGGGQTVHRANWFSRFVGGASNQANDPDKSAKKNAKALGTDPSFKSIFKPLATLMVVSKTLSGILRNSTIANTYGAAMGKVFGAALDILMIPFLPFFNMLLVLMVKLVAWLITSGVLQEIAKVVTRAVGYLEGIAHWIVEVWHAITNLDFGKLAELIIKGMGSAVKTLVKDPKGALMAGGLAVVGAAMLNKMMLGIPMMLAKSLFGVGKGVFGLGKGIAGMLGGGGGAGGAAAEGAAAGGELAAGGAAATGAAEAGVGGAAAAGAGEAAAGGSGMAGLLTFGGLGAGSLALAGGAGLAAGVGTNYLAGKAGVHGTARQALTGAAAGAAGGAVIGSVVPVLGTAVGAIGGGLIGGGIGLAKGLLGGGGGSQQQQAGNGIVNSNNVINLTQNNTFTNGNVNQKQIADDAIKEIERRTGFKLAVRGGH